MKQYFTEEESVLINLFSKEILLNLTENKGFRGIFAQTLFQSNSWGKININYYVSF
ncbi:hypothetical protein BB14905_04468 [Bacillus sp. B14905]|nr:hypothetical protein BB14905_04468 [Bacillus sp. B14905]